jgi:hypothetical protein
VITCEVAEPLLSSISMIHRLSIQGCIDDQQPPDLPQRTALRYRLKHDTFTIFAHTETTALVQPQPYSHLFGYDKATCIVNGNYSFHLPILPAILNMIKR